MVKLCQNLGIKKGERTLMEHVHLNVLGKLEKFKIKFYKIFAKVKMLVKMSIWWAPNDGKKYNVL
jgi:hypothetical protein